MKNEEDKTLLEFNIKMRCEMLSGIIEILTLIKFIAYILTHKITFIFKKLSKSI